MKNGLELIVLYTCLTKKQGYRKDVIEGMISGLRRLAARKEVPSIEELRPLVGHLRFFNVLQKIAGDNGTNPFGTDTVSYYWRCFPSMKGEGTHNEAVLGDYERLSAGHIPQGVVVELNNCLVFDGEVVSEFADNRRLLVKRRRISDKDGQLVLGNTEEVTVSRGEDIGDTKLKHGDHVTLHWNVAVEKINDKEASALNEETQNALDRFNARRA